MRSNPAETNQCCKPVPSSIDGQVKHCIARRDSLSKSIRQGAPWRVRSFVGALSPVNHKGLHQG